MRIVPRWEVKMEKFTFFWDGPFSQWDPSPFGIQGQAYNCAEQWMMEQKAIFFKDEDARRRIMSTLSPRDQKAIGRKVRGFDPEAWDAVSRCIVYHGNVAKFNQNPSHKKALLATAGTTIVEASPYDQIWGIGLAEGDPRAFNRKTWRGRNWLGEVLTALREDYLSGRA